MKLNLPRPRLIWRFWALAVASLLALAYLADPAWWLPPAPSRLVHSTDRFELPLPTFRPSAATSATVREGALWGPLNAAGANVPEEVEQWEFSGTYFQGTAWVAIATWKSGKKPAQHLKAGDETPSGYKILEVAEDRMLLRVGTFKNKQPMTLWIPLHQAPPVVF